jgi:hypothetical protein
LSPRTVLESKVEHYFLEACRRRGALLMKFTSPSRSGVPDRILVTPAGTCFVEVKRPGEEPRPLQVATHEKIRRFGGEVYVVDSPQQIDELLDHLLPATT